MCCQHCISGITDKNFIIFLDMDGVLAQDFDWDAVRQTVNKLFPEAVHQRQPTSFQWLVAKAKYLHSPAVQMLHNLIQQLRARHFKPRIVLSTSWRIDADVKTMKERVFRTYEFSKLIISRTEDEKCHSRKGHPRENVIIQWLQTHNVTDNFIILDDMVTRFFPRLESHFVTVDPHSLLTEIDVKKVLSKIDG